MGKLWSRSLTSPVACGDPHGFLAGQSSSSVAHSPAAWLNTEDEPFQEGFRTFFPRMKKVRLSPGTWGARVPRHVSSSTSSAYGPRTWVDDDTGEVWTLLTDPALGSWWYSSRTRRSQWHPLGCAGAVDVPVLMQRRGCLQFFDLVDMPVIVYRHVRSLCGDVVATSVVAQRQIPMVRSCVSLILQYNDKVVVVLSVQRCERPSSSHSCSLDMVVDMPVMFNDSPWFNVQKTAVVPQLLRVLWWPVSLLCRSCWCRFLRLWTPCDHAATSLFSSTIEVPQIQFSVRVVDIPVVQQRGARLPTVLVMTAMSGFFGAFCAIFRAPLVIPELSASFRSPR